MKRNLPVAVWQKIQPIINQYRHLIIPVVSEEYSLLLSDNVPGTGFYFRCNQVKETGKYRMEQRPTNISSNEILRQDAELTEMANWLKQWFEALDGYEKLQTVYDDPISKSYEAEFASYFAMQDEDADTAPFDFLKQLYLDQYLSDIKGVLENRLEEATPEQKIDLEVIIEECESLRDDMTQLTKNQALGQLARIWAKARKFGIPLIKEMLGEFKKEGIKAIVKGTLEHRLLTMEDIMGYFN